MKAFPKEDILKLDSLLSGTGKVCITTHTHPDGDALGSAYGMLHFLRDARGLDAIVVINDRWPSYLDFAVSGADEALTIIREEAPEAADSALKDCRLIVCTDFNASSRISELEAALLSSKAHKLLIDHHLSPQREIFDLVFSETEISSASELELLLLEALPQIGGDASKLPAEALTLLMTGITTDTNNFANSVFPSTLKACSELIAAGVDRDEILDRLYRSYSEERVRATARFTADYMRIMPQGAAYIIIDEATFNSFGLVKGDTEGLVNVALGIDKVKLSILLRQEGEVYRASIRSKRGVSANTFAIKYFEGGGHERASGGKLRISQDIRDAADVERYVRKCIEDFCA